MLILLISTTLSLAMPMENKETVKFFGIVPAPTCNLDKSIEIDSDNIDSKIRCPDNRYVFIKKVPIWLDDNAINNVWVIEYGKEK